MEKQAWQEDMPPLAEWTQDPEGNALVEDILARKAADNAREKMLQLFIWGDYQTDERGDVIPRKAPDFWDYLARAFRSGEKISYTKYLNRPSTVSIDPADPATVTVWRGPEPRVMWVDEHLPSHHYLRAGGRGYGKRAALEAIRKLATTTTAPVTTIGSVRWACKKPTN